MIGRDEPVSDAPRKFFGLGWGLVYVAALYFLVLILVQLTGNKRLWVLWALSAVSAAVSALALWGDRGSPAGFPRSVLQALHYFNLAYAIVFTVLGFIWTVSHEGD